VTELETVGRAEERENRWRNKEKGRVQRRADRAKQDRILSILAKDLDIIISSLHAIYLPNQG